jgi:hypothetical protein
MRLMVDESLACGPGVRNPALVCLPRHSKATAVEARATREAEKDHREGITEAPMHRGHAIALV